MVATSVLQAVDSLVTEVVNPSQYEQKIIVRLLQSINKILYNLFGTETFVVGTTSVEIVLIIIAVFYKPLKNATGSAFNDVLVPNESVEATQLLSCKSFKQWSVEASSAINKVVIFH